MLQAPPQELDLLGAQQLRSEFQRAGMVTAAGRLRRGSSLNGPVFTELAGGRVQGFLQIRCGHVMKGHVWGSLRCCLEQKHAAPGLGLREEFQELPDPEASVL